MLWGESQFRQEFTVDREGYIFLPEVGQVFVNGLNLRALEKKLFQILSKVYSTLNPLTGNPTTFIDISLGNLRPLRIIVLGDVSQPGGYQVSPSASLLSSLYYFNGPNEQGSLRKIQLIRKGEQIGLLDFYSYLLSGNVPNDFRLQLDDIVFIPPRGKTITIKGLVVREAIYELKNDEGLNELIQFAGGLKVNAYTKRIQISRIVPYSIRPEIGMDRMYIDIDLESVLNENQFVELYDGDVIEVFPILESKNNYVIINGSSVIRPGKYQLQPNMSVVDIINSADGLLKDVYLPLAHISRLTKDLTKKLITIDLEKALDNDLDHNIKLQPMDKIEIYNKNLLMNSFNNVEIKGGVKSPGIYDYHKDLTLGDLIISSGGFKKDIVKVKISVSRVDIGKFEPNIYNFPSKNYGNEFYKINDLSFRDNEINNFKLKSNDLIDVYIDPRDKLYGSVEVLGGVYFPGSYSILSKNEKVTDVINRAGGLLPEAYPLASIFSRKDQVVRLSFADIITNPNSKDNFNVAPGDKINILLRPNIIEISGEVNNPGKFKYHSKYSLKKYIDIAGGYTVDAEKKEVWVEYPNGTSRKLKRFSFSPEVLDGSKITIGVKKESEPVDKTELAKEIASIISDFLQIALTLTLLSSTSS